MNGEGLLEIYRFTHEQMEEIYKLIGEDKVKPYSVKQIENILEAYKLIKEYGTAMELPAEEKIPRRAIKTYSVKEIEKLLKGRVSSSEFEDVRCRKIFEKIKGDLERYFGPQLADKLLDIQFKKLGIGKEITCRDVGMIMADLESGILEKILGKERSEVAIERFKEYFNVYALE
jgi:hypothetical protein